MNTINVQARKLDTRQYVRRSALESDYTTLITEPTVLVENGRVRAAYLLPEWDWSELLATLRKVKYTESTRTSGLKTVSRIFGYAPRNVIRKDYCNPTGLAKDQPSEHGVIMEFGAKVAALYQQHFPEMYDSHIAKVERVLPNYRIEHSPFTSGIINRNNPLKYHFDSGNFKGVASCMIALRDQAEGGHLVMPEYDLALEIAHGSVSIFDGQDILHGVSPIRYTHKDGYRYTMVYYSLEQMWKCLEPMGELDRIRTVKTAREVKRAGR